MRTKYIIELYRGRLQIYRGSQGVWAILQPFSFFTMPGDVSWLPMEGEPHKILAIAECDGLLELFNFILDDRFARAYALFGGESTVLFPTALRRIVEAIARLV